MKLMTQAVVSRMNTAYYVYWRGDRELAAKILIDLADKLFKEEKVGKRKQEAPLGSKEAAAPDTGRKGYVSRVQFPSEESLEDARYSNQF